MHWSLEHSNCWLIAVCSAKRKSNAAAVSTTNSANQNEACIIKDAAQLHRFRWLLFSP